MKQATFDIPVFVYTASETASILKVNEKTVRRLIDRGLLKKSKAIRHIRITRQSLDEFLAHWRLLLAKFKVDDVLWMGDKFDSGKPEHACHFKTAVEWLGENTVPAPFICPASFKNNSHARSNDNVLARRFLVVESDVLTKDQVGAVFKWLQADAKQELVAIVDTAGKSLHGWFRYPADDQVDHLKTILPAYGCDPKLFTASQPVRLPGALRGEKHQKLVYLSNGGAA